MRTTDPGDAARIELLLAELRLPAVKQVWASLAAQADKEGWPAGRFLAALAEHEIAERAHRRLERHLAEARLPPGRKRDASPRAKRGCPPASGGLNTERRSSE
jgi:DNA replication protein DnaC